MDRVFFWLLGGLLALSPLPWGSIALWAASFWAVLVCAYAPGDQVPPLGATPG